jgi:predicted nuclease with TOPRIM domain
MTEVDRLWTRIEEAKKRLGATDEAQIKQIQDINEQVKEVRAGLKQRYRELERHREDVSKLRHENEHLRRMLHRLLLAIEQRYNGRLMDLVKDLEGEVSALVPLAAGPKQVRARSVEKAIIAKRPAAPTPSESDSRWLQEIMERAREFTGEDGTSPSPRSDARQSQGAHA